MNVGKNSNLLPIDVLENPDYQIVMDQYVLKGKPVLLRGIATEWIAYKKWTGPEFIQKYGKIQVTARIHVPKLKEKTFTLSDYLDYMQTTTDERPYYLSAWRFASDYPELLNDYTVPDYFENWVRRIPEYLLKRQDYDYFLRWMYIGAKNTGSPMHRDVLDTSAWNAVLSGKKEWLFYSSDETENLYPTDRDNSPVNGFAPDLTIYPKFKDVMGYTCIQEPGDIVFTPSLWWHQVRNLEAGISLTENFINHSNINAVSTYYRLTLGRDTALDAVMRKYIPEMDLPVPTRMGIRKMRVRK